VHAIRLALPLVVLSLGLAACGGDDDKSSDYPSGVERNFLNACNKSSKGKEDACKCALDKLEDTVSYEDFKKADAAIRSGKSADPRTTEKLQAAIKACV
jgi:hypothetical protein